MNSNPLLRKIIEICKLPKTFTARLIHKGENTEANRLNPTGIELTCAEDVAKLDTGYTNLISVEEWEVTVQIRVGMTEPETAVENKFGSSVTFEEILEFVKAEVKLPAKSKPTLFCGKEKITRKFPSIGSLCNGTNCSLICLDPSDKDQRAKYGL